jgi:hypothetical protein
VKRNIAIEKDALNAKYNVKHPFLIHDVNGMAIASATRKETAFRRARFYKEHFGLDMQVCFKAGRGLNQIIWFRTTRRKTLRLNSNGTWSQKRGF